MVVATVMLLAGVGIGMHAERKYVDKLYYHTVASTLYSFDDVFAERTLGHTLQSCGAVVGLSGGVWFVFLKISRKS